MDNIDLKQAKNIIENNCIDIIKNECKICIRCNDDTMELVELCKIPANIKDNIISYTGSNCIDFLGKFYLNKENKNGNLYFLANDLISYNTINRCIKQCDILKTHDNAVIPFKKNVSDVGYDLTIISIHKKISDITTLYDTGIRLFMKDPNYYSEIVARSSLIKSGYILTNSVGIIDNAYNGNLYISLTKIDPNAKDIELPFKPAQLIFKTQIHVSFNEIINKNNVKNSRMSGGFGSTN